MWVGENWKRGPEQMKSQKQQKIIAANGELGAIGGAHIPSVL
jgi:hypothetical protein